jgi:hypothetical protein
MLVGARVGVRVAVDSLQHPLGVLVLHLLFLVFLRVHLLFALPLVGRRVIMARLLRLLLTDLLHELFDFLACLGAMALGVMHRASHTAVVVVERMTGVLVTTCVMAPTYCFSHSSGCTGQRLNFATDLLSNLLLLILLLLATTLSSGIQIGLVDLLCLWSRWRMLGAALFGPNAVVRKAEELGDVLHVVCG